MKKTSTVVVTGGRNFRNEEFVRKVLSEFRPPIKGLVQGGAKGADALAAAWAFDNQVKCVEYRANWAMEGLAAGHNRNREMLVSEKPDFVIAFPGGSGTANCKSQARWMKHVVCEYNPNAKTPLPF